jgi:CheY-like chemotaxis protein
LLNLIGNAIKFTERGGVTDAVSQDGGPRGLLRFEVIDTGIGIAPGAEERLFQRFSQVDGSDSRSHGGVGLGLAISKGLVDLMGGQIGVISEEARGSTFWFTVPVSIASVGEERGGAASAEGPAAGARILIVDDVAANRELMAALLAPFGATIAEARDGEEAVSASLESGFDLILMDLQMPRMDGYQATRAIRAQSNRNCATPILAVSADVLPQHVEACRAAGMDGHVAKPIDPRDLLIKVSHYVQA